MGHVKWDIHKRDRNLEQQYPFWTTKGILTFFEYIHHIREARLRGDISAALFLLDFNDAYEKAKLTEREKLVLYYRYELGYTLKETSSMLDISLGTVDGYVRNGATKIANIFTKAERREIND